MSKAVAVPVSSRLHSDLWCRTRFSNWVVRLSYCYNGHGTVSHSSHLYHAHDLSLPLAVVSDMKVPSYLFWVLSVPPGPKFCRIQAFKLMYRTLASFFDGPFPHRLD